MRSVLEPQNPQSHRAVFFLFFGVFHILDAEYEAGITPPKINMEPGNDGFQ